MEKIIEEYMRDAHAAGVRSGFYVGVTFGMIVMVAVVAFFKVII